MSVDNRPSRLSHRVINLVEIAALVLAFGTGCGPNADEVLATQGVLTLVPTSGPPRGFMAETPYPGTPSPKQPGEDFQPASPSEGPNVNQPTNCAVIRRGSNAWATAQSFGNPTTIYDYETYTVWNTDGSYRATIKPVGWQVTDVSENAQKARQTVEGMCVTAE